MISIFAFPKPFHGHIGIIQRNAIHSWKQLRPQCEIVLFGNEEGTADVAKEFHLCHVPDIARNEFGTPLLSDVFEKGGKLATYTIHCYVNCDIILPRELMSAVIQVSAWRARFLLVGQCWGLDVRKPIAFDQATWAEDLRGLVSEQGVLRGLAAIDYFVFPRGLYQALPPFALGRAKFDNWLVWRARNLRAPVVDATNVVFAVHQNHDYSHVAGGQDYTIYGQEAMQNLEYAGGVRHIYGISDATHKLLPTGIWRHWRGCLRLEFRKAWLHSRRALVVARAMTIFWWFMERTRPVRHALGLHGKNLSRLKNLHRKNGRISRAA